MLLVVTESHDATANYLCSRLREARVSLVRIDSDSFSDIGFVEYRSGDISLWSGRGRYSAEDITSVWYRRPRGISIRGEFSSGQMLHAAREWGAALDCFLAHVARERWMNHPAANALAANKLLQLTRARGLGLQIPDTLVPRSAEDAKLFWSKHEGRVVVKPLSVSVVEAGDGDVVAAIYTNVVKKSDLDDGALIPACPTLFQEQVVGGTDVRITVVDRNITALDLLPPKDGVPSVDIRKSGMSHLSYRPVDVPGETASRILQLVELLGLRFAAIDMIRTIEGSWYFLEVNPDGQWAWMDLLGASNIAAQFARAFRGENDA